MRRRIRNKEIASAAIKYTEGRFKSIEAITAQSSPVKQESIEEFIARGGRIKRLPPARSK